MVIRFGTEERTFVPEIAPLSKGLILWRDH